MQTHLKVSLTPMVKIVLHSCLSVTLTALTFGGGWYLRYAVKEGIPAASQRFHDRVQKTIETLRRYAFFNRIFDAVTGDAQEDLGFLIYLSPDRKPHQIWTPPVKTPKPTPSAVTASPSPVGPSPKPGPKASPRRVVFSLVHDELLEFLENCSDLPAADKKSLTSLVRSWSRLQASAVVVSLAEALDKLVYLKPDVRTNIVCQMFQLSEVSNVFKFPSADEPERIVWGWDVPDIRAAYTKGGVAQVAKLANGRPPSFFVGLAADQAPFRTCRENLQALQDGKARPEGALRNDSTPRVSCPKGKYEHRQGRPWSCSFHQTLAEPFPLAVKLIRYMDPVDTAAHYQLNGQVDVAYEELDRLLRRYPQHVIAAGGLAELYYSRKDWTSLRDFLVRWIGIAPACQKNVRWTYYLALAAHGLGNAEQAKEYARRSIEGNFNAPPPNVSSRKELYLLQDKAAEILEASNKGIKFGDYAATEEDAFPSSVCFKNLSSLRDAMTEFTRKYPASHPDLFKAKQSIAKANQILASNPDPARAAKVQARMAQIQARIDAIMADTQGEHFWKALGRFLLSHPPQPCPNHGRYVFQGHEFLQCSVHPDILLEPLTFTKQPVPNHGEEDELTRCLLNGTLAVDGKRRDCFALQKKYIASKGGESLPAGDVTSSTVLPDGQTLRCPEGGSYKVVNRAGANRLVCSYHGSYEEYFSGFGELLEKEESH